MGPVRARLITPMALLSPAPALAEACGQLRPDWVAEAAPVSWVGELIFVFTSPPGIALLVLFGLAMWRGWRWLLALVALAGCALAFLLFLGNSAELAAAARSEGCMGSQNPAAMLSLFLGLLAFLSFWKRLG